MRRRRYLRALFGTAAIILIIWGWVTWERAVFPPTMLRRPVWYYAWTIPQFLKHCLVAKGTREERLIARFGPPDAVYDSSAPEFRRRLDNSERFGWSKPPPLPGTQTLFYDIHNGYVALRAFYFVDASGRAVGGFVNED